MHLILLFVLVGSQKIVQPTVHPVFPNGQKASRGFPNFVLRQAATSIRGEMSFEVEF